MSRADASDIWTLLSHFPRAQARDSINKVRCLKRQRR